MCTDNSLSFKAEYREHHHRINGKEKVSDRLVFQLPQRLPNPQYCSTFLNTRLGSKDGAQRGGECQNHRASPFPGKPHYSIVQLSPSDRKYILFFIFCVVLYVFKTILQIKMFVKTVDCIYCIYIIFLCFFFV